MRGIREIEGLIKEANRLYDNDCFNEALKLYDQALEKSPNNVVCLDSKGSTLIALYRYDEALKMFERSIALNGDRYQPYQGKAWALSGLDENPKALECFDTALSKATDDKIGEPLAGKATVHAELDEDAKSDECIDKALKSNESFAYAWCVKGNLQMKKDELDMALKCYETALNKDPKCVLAHNGIGYIHLKKGNNAATDIPEDSSFSSAEAQDGEPGKELPNRRPLNQAQLSEYAAAEGRFQKALEIKPKYAEALNGLGCVCKARANNASNVLNELEKQALDYFDKALEHKPEYDDALKNRAEIVIKIKEQEFQAKFGDRYRIIAAAEKYTKADMSQIGAALVNGSFALIDDVSQVGAVTTGSCCILNKRPKEQHWTAFCVCEMAGKTFVLYKDSMGERIPYKLEDSLKRKLGSNIACISHCVKEQVSGDDTVSGPMSLNNMRLMRNGLADSRRDDYIKNFIGAKLTPESQVAKLKEEFQALTSPTFLDEIRGYISDLKSNDKFVEAYGQLLTEISSMTSMGSAKEFNAMRAAEMAKADDSERDFAKLYTSRLVASLSTDEIKKKQKKLEKSKNKYVDEFFRLNKAFDVITRLKSGAASQAALQTIAAELKLDYGQLASYFEFESANNETTSDRSKDGETKKLFLEPMDLASIKVAATKPSLPDTNKKTTEQLISELVLGADDQANGQAATKGAFQQSLARIQQHYFSWQSAGLGQVNAWAKSARISGGLLSTDEAIAVMDRTNNIITGGHRLRESQIISVLAFLDTRPDQGRLCEIKTGEGKTTIVALLAALKVLQGKSVDVITSNKVLAEEGKHEMEHFYAALGLTVATNGHDAKYTSGPKHCYTADIVYGCISDFQFDFFARLVRRAGHAREPHLRHAYSGRGGQHAHR